MTEEIKSVPRPARKFKLVPPNDPRVKGRDTCRIPCDATCKLPQHHRGDCVPTENRPTERIRQIRERLEAATEGDWSSVQGHESDDWGVTEAGTDGKSIAQMCWEWDAKFIANAKSDIEFLLRLAELASLPVGESTPTISRPKLVDELARELENRFMLYTLAGHKGSWLFQKLAEAAILSVPELGLGESREPLPSDVSK